MTDPTTVAILYSMALAGGGYEAVMTDGTRIKFEPPYCVSVLLPTPEMAESLRRIREAEASKRPYRSRYEMNKRKAEAILRKRAYAAYPIDQLAREMDVTIPTMKRWLKGVA